MVDDVPSAESALASAGKLPVAPGGMRDRRQRCNGPRGQLPPGDLPRHHGDGETQRDQLEDGADRRPSLHRGMLHAPKMWPWRMARAGQPQDLEYGKPRPQP